MKSLIILFLFSFLASAVEQVGIGYGHFEDNKGLTKNINGAIFQKDLHLLGSENKTNMSVYLTQARTYDESPDEYWMSELTTTNTLDSTTYVIPRVRQELGASFGLSQNFGADHILSANYSKRSDQISNTTSYGFGYGQWFLLENLKIDASFSRTDVTQPVYHILAGDYEQIEYPQQVAGNNYGLSVTHLTSKSTLSTLGYTYLQRSDKRPAQKIQGTIKQYISPTDGAVQIKGTFQKDYPGEIPLTTAVGRLSAFAIDTIYFQSLPWDAITKFRYRYYQEDQEPRITSEPVYKFGSDLFGIYYDQNLLPIFGGDKENSFLLDNELHVEISYKYYITNDNGAFEQVDKYKARIIGLSMYYTF